MAKHTCFDQLLYFLIYSRPPHKTMSHRLLPLDTRMTSVKFLQYYMLKLSRNNVTGSAGNPMACTKLIPELLVNCLHIVTTTVQLLKLIMKAFINTSTEYTIFAMNSKEEGGKVGGGGGLVWYPGLSRHSISIGIV